MFHQDLSLQSIFAVSAVTKAYELKIGGFTKAVIGNKFITESILSNLKNAILARHDHHTMQYKKLDIVCLGCILIQLTYFEQNGELPDLPNVS